MRLPSSISTAQAGITDSEGAGADVAQAIAMLHSLMARATELGCDQVIKIEYC